MHTHTHEDLSQISYGHGNSLESAVAEMGMEVSL